MTIVATDSSVLFSITNSTLHVTAITRKSREIVFDNGESCPCSCRAWRMITEKMSIKAFQQNAESADA